MFPKSLNLFSQHECSSTLKIGNIRQEHTCSGWRVYADVDGVPLWFQSRNVQLHPSPEAFASAMLIPALQTHRTLEMSDPLCATWLENNIKLQQILNSWWNYPILPPQCSAIRDDDVGTVDATAQCFTGGVDSFHALLNEKVSPQYLLFVHGYYDIPLQEQRRMDAFQQFLDLVAKEVNAIPIVIQTNLRTHPASQKNPWINAHGGALAAAGHLLQTVTNNLLIPSSWSYENFYPWGSNWDLDPLWSSRCFQIKHADASLNRAGKLQQIHKSELVRKHLRVCLEKNRGPTGNCSRCEKCIRTMTSISLYDNLNYFPTFDNSELLATRIRKTPTVSKQAIDDYYFFLEKTLDPATRKAIKQLIVRSERIHRLQQVLPRPLEIFCKSILKRFLTKKLLITLASINLVK